MKRSQYIFTHPTGVPPVFVYATDMAAAVSKFNQLEYPKDKLGWSCKERQLLVDVLLYHRQPVTIRGSLDSDRGTRVVQSFGAALGATLIEARQKAGLSQKKLADVLGVSTKTIATMEQGKRSTRFFKLVEACAYLRLDIALILANCKPYIDMLDKVPQPTVNG